MEAKELRLGNYYSFLDEFFQVGSIDATVINPIVKGCDKVVSNTEHSLNLKPIHIIGEFTKPIPLTEEWLVKFGFELYICIDGVQGDKFNDFIFINYSQIRTLTYGEQSLILKDDSIQYVHQLQNLYFALTGQELTIK